MTVVIPHFMESEWSYLHSPPPKPWMQGPPGWYVERLSRRILKSLISHKLQRCCVLSSLQRPPYPFLASEKSLAGFARPICLVSGYSSEAPPPSPSIVPRWRSTAKLAKQLEKEPAEVVVGVRAKLEDFQVRGAGLP